MMGTAPLGPAIDQALITNVGPLFFACFQNTSGLGPPERPTWTQSLQRTEMKTLLDIDMSH